LISFNDFNGFVERFQWFCFAHLPFLLRESIVSAWQNWRFCQTKAQQTTAQTPASNKQSEQAGRLSPALVRSACGELVQLLRS
jgi:hypothetical protein